MIKNVTIRTVRYDFNRPVIRDELVHEVSTQRANPDLTRQSKFPNYITAKISLNLQIAASSLIITGLFRPAADEPRRRVSRYMISEELHG